MLQEISDSNISDYLFHLNNIPHQQMILKEWKSDTVEEEASGDMRWK